MLLLGLLAFLIGLVSDTVWALLASRLRDWFNASAARGRAWSARRGSMVGLGLALAATGRPDSAAPDTNGCNLHGLRCVLVVTEPRRPGAEGWAGGDAEAQQAVLAWREVQAVAVRATPSSPSTWRPGSRACCARRTC